MKRLSTQQLIPGMIAAEDVLSYNKQLLIPKGTRLNDRLITKLDLYSILTMNVEDEISGEAEPQKNAAPLTYHERIRSNPVFGEFKNNYELNISSFQETLNNVVQKNCQLDLNGLLDHCIDTLSFGKGQLGILDMLQNMRDYDDTTYAHCLNVALIANVFATWLNWSPKNIEIATACGLLHDIGKLTIPYDIIAKPGKLSEAEYAQVRQHPISGYKLLLSQDLDNHVRNAALMHHERNDGTGYPMHLKGSQIDRYAKLIAIADVYDAMTASRVYRGPLCPFRVIELFETEGFEKYDMAYLMVILQNIVNTYIQNRCRLSDGREGRIILVNKEKFSRPVVKCDDEYVDLAEHPSLYISELL